MPKPTKRRQPVLAVALFLLISLQSNSQPESGKTSQPAKINRTTLSNGTILLNEKPFPMVLDAGTDTFTPQDYNIVMGNKDGFGANTWWLQYAMRHMKSETEGDFSGLARALDFFEETGMLVNLYLRAEYRDLPDWFYQRNSDYQMLDPQGKPVGRQICLQHEGFRRLIDQYLRRAVAAARDKKSLLMYSVYDEFCIRGWGCFCHRCIAAYRDYLKGKYKELGKLNQAWNATYDSWNQIDAPRTQTFDRNYGDWQHYRLKVLHDFGMLYYKAVKETDPDHLVWIDINMDLYDYTWQRLCVWWKLTDIFDTFNLGPDATAEGAPIRTAMNRAIRDNYGKAATWHRGIFSNEFMAKPDIYSLLFESNHGGLVWWYSFWDVLRTDRAWGAGDEAETAVQANWFAARELNHLVQYLGDLYVYSKPVRGEVGAFVSGLTDMMRSVTDKQVLQIEEPRNLGGLCQILRDLNIPYEAFGEDQLKNLRLFKVILLGQFSMCADEATAAAFRDYVYNGGTLVVTNYALSADANGRQITNPGFGLDEVWGSSGGANDQTEEGRILIGDDVPFEGRQRDALPGQRRSRHAKGHPPAPPLVGGILKALEMPTLGGVARRKIRTAQVIARHSDGTPAITWNRYGKGQVLFIGTNAGEVYNTGQFLAMGKYRNDHLKTRLTVEEYRKLVERYQGWQNYALLLREVLNLSGVQSPVVLSAPNESDLLGKARANLQEQRASGSGPVNHFLVITLEPIYNPVAEIQKRPDEIVKPERRVLKNLTIRAKIPESEKVTAVYHIPPIGYQMGKIDAVPEKVPFKSIEGELQIILPEVSEVACLLVARDARPLVGVKSEQISAQEDRPTRILVTVDNATSEEIAGEITFSPGFRATPVGAETSRFSRLQPGESVSAEFDVTAPPPIEKNRTFQAIVPYERRDGRAGSAQSYPVTSRTDERIAWSWVKRVEADMAGAATPPTPWGNLYEEALQKREFVYAAYNSGAYADTIRLAKEHAQLCKQIKEQRTQRTAIPKPD
ncbi:MAG: hypothetical protein DMG06_20050 [Acidobacteria bacterium]|nr:MAG: hypothetical protein DMG06_20050 [Acidobacteriota bacterium]